MWTAGHCVGDGSGAFYSDFLFVPGYRNGSKPAGEWVYDQVVTTSQWANAGDFRFDVAALTMAPSGGQKIEEVVGGRGIRFNQPHLQSYEASDILRRRPSTARSCSCASRISAPSPRSATALPQPMGIGCDMTGGSSGGGWVVAGEFVQSVNSFTLDAIEDVIFGPQLGDAALAVYERASGEELTPPRITGVSDKPDPFTPNGRVARTRPRSGSARARMRSLRSPSSPSRGTPYSRSPAEAFRQMTKS